MRIMRAILLIGLLAVLVPDHDAFSTPKVSD